MANKNDGIIKRETKAKLSLDQSYSGVKQEYF